VTRERISELRHAGAARGDERINDSAVECADFTAADVEVEPLTWGELRELLDVWESDDRRVG
jgi:hypothetical protein